MKKMNIRQAFAKMKKMFPGVYLSARREYAHYSSNTEKMECRVYANVSNPGHTWGLSGEADTFEEAIKKLKEQINEIQNS